MRCTVTLAREGAAVIARCSEFPECTGRGAGRTEAMTKLRDSVLFWLESCPCDQTAGPGLELVVVKDETS